MGLCGVAAASGGGDGAVPVGDGPEQEEEEEEEDEEAAEVFLLAASSFLWRCSHLEIWTFFLLFVTGCFLFGVWVLPDEYML